MLVALSPLAGCDAFSPGVTNATITGVEVTALDFDRPWDSPITGDLPDVYLHIKTAGSVVYGNEVWRSETRENVGSGALPLGFRPEDATFDLDETAVVNVVDRDGTLHDEMFSTGALDIADLYQGEERGTVSTRTFADSTGAVTLTLRWN